MWNSGGSVPKGINDPDTERHKMPVIPRQQRQSVMEIPRDGDDFGETQSDSGLNFRDCHPIRRH